MKFSTFCLTILICSFYAMGARAESLTEADIRSLYAEESNAYSNPQLTQKIFEHRWADNFQMAISQQVTFESNPAKTDNATLDRKQAVDSMVDSIKTQKPMSHNLTIVEIKTTPDQNIAYASMTQTESGTMLSPVENSQPATVSYSSAESCVDTLTLNQGVITMQHKHYD